MDVYDTAGNRLGDGPVFAVKSANIRRALDGAGSWRANCVATDARALALLTVGRVVRLWGEDQGGMRLLGEGLIAKWRLSEDPTGVALILDGPDLLEEVKRKNTLLGRIYNQQTVQAVCDDLIGLAPGWSVSVDGAISGDVIDARFDGVNVLKAFIEIAERYGFHVRAAQGATRTLEVGAFGAASGLRVHKIETISAEALANPALLMVQRIVQDRLLESSNYYDVLIPLGAGEGTAALTLERSTRTTPYAVQSISGPDGSTLYYISTTTYPAGGYNSFLDDPAATVRVGQFKELAPLSNSETDIRNAANALYDAAATDLARSSVMQEQYSLIVKNTKVAIAPGDTIAIDYKAQTPEGGTYLAVRGDYVVLGVTEQIGLDGSDVTLDVSNVARYERDEAELVFDAVQKLDVRNLKPNVTPGPPAAYVYQREIAPGYPALVPVEISDATVELLRCRLRIVTGPFRSVTSVAAATPHQHTWASVPSAPPSPSGWSNRIFGFSDGGSIYFFQALSNYPLPFTTVQLLALNENPAHTHVLSFGAPVDDSQTPAGITAWFAGNDVTNTLFGVASLAPSGGAINVLADAGALANLLINAAGGLRQRHVVELRCSGGRGRVEVTVELFQTTQAIKIG